MNNPCVFCNIVKENKPHHEIIWEDENHIAFLDINPSKPGHTLVIPKTHSVSHLDLNDAEYSELFLAVRKVSQLIKEKLQVKLVGVAIEGFSVAHTHVHLIPLNDGEKLAHFNNFVPTKEELSNVAKKILKF